MLAAERAEVDPDGAAVVGEGDDVVAVAALSRAVATGEAADRSRAAMYRRSGSEGRYLSAPRSSSAPVWGSTSQRTQSRSAASARATGAGTAP